MEGITLDKKSLKKSVEKFNASDAKRIELLLDLSTGQVFTHEYVTDTINYTVDGLIHLETKRDTEDLQLVLEEMVQKCEKIMLEYTHIID